MLEQREQQVLIMLTGGSVERKNQLRRRDSGKFLISERNAEPLLKLLDDTLRAEGYHNAWDFSPDLIAGCLKAMRAAGVNVVEVGDVLAA